MRAEGMVEIAASCGSTWDALTDPVVLAGCVPGAGSVSIEPVGPAELALKGRIGQGFLSLPAEGRVELSDLVRPDAATATLRGSVAGTALEASARVTLEETGPERTLLRWAADASIAGPLAGMAAPFLDREGPGLVERTLDCLRIHVEAAAGPEAA